MGLGVAVVGVGGLGHLLTDILADLPDARVVAGSDVSPTARDGFESTFGAPAYADLDELLDAHADLDAVLVVTPHTLHFDQAKTCLERGLHVLVEKPMVTDVGDAVELVATADEHGLVLQVGYQRHFHPAFREMKRVVDEGRVGDLHAINCYLGQDWITPHRRTWRVDPDLSGGGQLYDTGSHLLDALLWTTSADPDTVTARIEYAEPRIDVNSALALTLDVGGESVTTSVLVSGDGVAIDPAEGYAYWGTDGRLTYADRELVVAEKDAPTYTATFESGTDFHSVNQRKLQHFVDCVESGHESKVPGEFALLVTALTEAAYLADQRDEVVDVRELIEEARAERLE
jgi:predicted dehydrogenase